MKITLEVRSGAPRLNIWSRVWGGRTRAQRAVILAVLAMLVLTVGLGKYQNWREQHYYCPDGQYRSNTLEWADTHPELQDPCGLPGLNNPITGR